MSNLFYDWAHKAPNAVLINEDGEIVKEKSIVRGDNIYVENIPAKLATPLLKKGVNLNRCSSLVVSQFREANGIVKTDENDARAILELWKIDPALFKPYYGPSPLMNLVAEYEKITTTIVAGGNRAWANGGSIPVIGEVLDGYEVIKKMLEKAIKKELEKYPIWTEYLIHIKGIGPAIAGRLVANIEKPGGIVNFPNASKLVAYFGLHQDAAGVAARNKKGQKKGLSNDRKSLMLGITAKAFLMASSQYKTLVYDPYKHRLENMTFPEGALHAKYNGKYYKPHQTERRQGHIDKMARRKMVQIFLIHLWAIWRKLEGLPTRTEYVFEYLQGDHTNYLYPPVIPESLKPYSPL